MAERDLKLILHTIIEKVKDDGYAQSDRHVSDTLVTFVEIDDILKAWYEHQWRLSQKGGRTDKGAKRAAIRTVDKDWQELKAVRRGAFMAYKRALRNALKGRPYALPMRGGTNDIIWRYLSWVGKGLTAKKVHDELNKTAMGAMAVYVDKYWKKAEANAKLGRPSYVNNSAQGSANTSGTLASYAINFAHGSPEGQQHNINASHEVGSTTGSVGVLEEILSGELRKKFEGSNPVIDTFITDIVEMFETEANIQIVDMSKPGGGGGHKNTIIIKGYVTSRRNNTQNMKRWDRDVTGHTGIQKRLQEVMDLTFEQLFKDLDKLGELAGYDVFDITSSPSQREIVLDKGVRIVLKEIKKTNPGAVITFANKKVKQKKKSTAANKSKKKLVKRTSKIKKAKRIAATKTRPGSRGPKRNGAQNITNPIGLVALLNRSLPAEVAKNMAPIRGSFPSRLTWRTGRFAGSAEVTNIVPFPRSVEVQYTYQHDPYAVFEQDSGDPRATGPARDPRDIIGGTVRQLAQSIMGTKYGLVRTKRV